MQELNKLKLSGFFLLGLANINMNGANSNPLIGMVEPSRDLFFANENGGVNSRWTHDAANPIDDELLLAATCTDSSPSTCTNLTPSIGSASSTTIPMTPIILSLPCLDLIRWWKL